MARKGVNIPVASDTRAFSKGVKDGVLDPLQEASDALEKVTRDGDKAGDHLERSLHDAQRETEGLKHETKQLHDTIEKGARTSYRRMADASDDATSTASRNVRALRDEARQNFAEVASSFDGSVQGVTNGLQGLTGGLAASMGGWGIAVATLGAGAAGFYQMWKEATERTKQRVSDMYDDMRESGQDFLSQEFINQRISDIVSGADDAVMQMKTVAAISREAGVTQAEVIAAAAGDLEARAHVMETLNARLEVLKDALDNAASQGEVYDIGVDIGEVADLRDKFVALNDEQAKATDQVKLFGDALEVLNRNANDDRLTPYFAGVTAEVKRTQDALNALPPVRTVKIELDTSSADSALRRLTSPQKVQVEAVYVTRDGRKVV